MTTCLTEKKNSVAPNYRGISQLHDDIDRLFGSFFDQDMWPGILGPRFARTFAPDLARDTASIMPQIEVKSDEKAYTLAVELPGVAPEDVKIEVHDNVLTISGEKKEEVKDESRTHVQERRYGSFMRQMSLPEDADADSIKAVAKNGVLSLEIARKAPEEGKVRSIEIQKA